jgi:hypothetical protein
MSGKFPAVIFAYHHINGLVRNPYTLFCEITAYLTGRPLFFLNKLLYTPSQHGRESPVAGLALLALIGPILSLGPNILSVKGGITPDFTVYC